jgi:hypothetical protein
MGRQLLERVACIMSLKTYVNNSWLARTIIESENVQQKVDEASEQYERFSEAWQGLTWLLARKGDEIGLRKANNDGVEYRLHKQAGVFGENIVPEITCLFTVTQNEIEIVEIKITVPKEDGEETVDF